jgi:hypothetical protein
MQFPKNGDFDDEPDGEAAQGEACQEPIGTGPAQNSDECGRVQDSQSD